MRSDGLKDIVNKAHLLDAVESGSAYDPTTVDDIVGELCMTWVTRMAG
jgi:hypothetical protein